MKLQRKKKIKKLSEYSKDFGQFLEKTPLRVVKATREDQIARCLKMARAESLSVSVRGAGHSSNGQSLNEGGLLFLNFSRRPRFKLLENGCVEVLTQTCWYDLEKALNRLGRSVPVMTKYLNLSVGGTLSVGGYGVRSLVQGGQIDHVKRLRLILPEGKALSCSPHKNSKLFQYALAGLGQVGMIEEVVMKTLPYHPLTFLYFLESKSLSHYAASLEWLLDWKEEVPDHFSASFCKGKMISTYGVGFSSIDSKRFGRISGPLTKVPSQNTKVIQDYHFALHSVQNEWVSRFQKHFRVWGDYFLDYKGFCKFLNYVEGELKKSHFSQGLEAIYSVVMRRPQRRLFFPLEARVSPLTFGVGFYYMIPWKRSDPLKNAKRMHDRLLEKCLEYGGRPYLFGYQAWGESIRRQVYGEAYEELMKLRQKLDPQGLFQGGKF
ncbi:MAG: FAD-binding oxidoreductase [Chlamydiae bacterium]|nr:FAD-binding oxidoreductase [Chlamydiota bacterium]